eukprot:331960_1
MRYYKCTPTQYHKTNKSELSEFTSLQLDLLVRDIELYNLKTLGIKFRPFLEFVLQWTCTDLNKYWLFGKSNGRKSGFYLILNTFIQFGIMLECDDDDEVIEKWMKKLLNIRFQQRKIDIIGLRQRSNKNTVFWRDLVKEAKRDWVIPKKGPTNWTEFKERYDSMIMQLKCLYEAGKVALEFSFVMLRLLYDRNKWNISNCECLWRKCNNKKTDKNLRKCSQCNVARYCSRSCQKKDWNKGLHRSFCRLYK